MPWYRSPKDAFEGALSSDVTISGTTLTSAAFASLGTNYSTNFVLPITLYDRQLGLYEIVWIVGHTASSTSVTVQRAKEDTPARAWTSGTAFVCAPTARDLMGSLSRSLLPSDAHTGQRYTLTDEGLTVNRTFDQGWQADVGIAIPGEFGLTQTDTAIANSKAIIMRGDWATATTNSSGKITITYKAPFPNNTVTAVASSRDAIVALDAANASTATFICINAVSGAPAGAGLSVAITYLAAGY